MCDSLHNTANCWPRLTLTLGWPQCQHNDQRHAPHMASRGRLQYTGQVGRRVATIRCMVAFISSSDVLCLLN